MTPDTSLWLGTENSLMRALHAKHYAMTHPEMSGDAKLRDLWDNSHDGGEDGEDEFYSPLIEVHGDVGILRIAGPMVAEDAWYNQMFGLISYAEISRAAMELGQLDQVKSVLLLADTPGGDVSGLEGASESLAWLASAKPLYTHNAGSMMSAGYWLGVEGRKITGTRMSETGSVGVLIVHRSVYQALKEQGMEYTVIRAGKFKALGHPSEQLSDEAKAILQDKANELYSLFLERISTKRQALSIATKDAWAEGKTFFGDKALQLGLIDELTTLSKRVVALDTSQEVDKRLQDSNNAIDTSLEEPTMPKGKTVILRSDKDKAALESGAALEDLNIVSTEEDEQSAAAANAAPTGSVTDITEAGDVSAAAVVGSTTGEDASAPTGLIAYLKEQNAALQDQVSGLKHRVSGLEAAAAQHEGDVQSLLGIAETSLHGMQVALDSAPLDIAGLPVATVVAQHAKTREAFEGKYRVGQQSARAPVQDAPEQPSAAAHKFGIVPKI